jgi:hypothetical protein
LSGLGIDNPDPRRRDKDVVDIPARARDEAVVERDHSVADLTLDECCKLRLASAALRPRGGVVALRHLLCDLSCMITMLSAHLLDSLVATSCSFSRC